MYNNIFISYASEDFKVADKIYSYFDNGFYKPWLDKRKLLPGQNWDIEIRQSLRNANFVIFLLSEDSVNKRGYFQKEYKLALEFCEEKLDDDIYIIPIKINGCETPERLKKYQWLELENNEIPFSSIVGAINTQIEKYLQNERRKNQLEFFPELIEKKINKIVPLSSKSNLFIEINYPQFKDFEEETLEFLNTLIKNTVLEEYISYNYSAYSRIEKGEDENCAIIIDYNISFLNKKIFSLIFFIRRDLSYPVKYRSIGHNYNIFPLYRLHISDLFNRKQKALDLIAAFCKEKFIEIVEDGKYTEESMHKITFYDVIKHPNWDFFENFYIKKSSIVFILTIFSLPFIYTGKQLEIEISFEKINSLGLELRTLRQLIENPS
ncbi:MAG TPA: toll/interleukin-1 receptor domain-containing protein [Cytophagaceae bacterium]|jgi:hypothetical protein|nr:toll/interleukin-1 receptor domain-containing protein [Cytophagaceae bacterium]